ncbi:hypothetical protein LW977_17880, partial [Erwinia amylovora]|uniref:hypothetical protein n=1 Tax=Erwinia amylovora TaxID=552 RepID=UPI0020BD6574
AGLSEVVIIQFPLGDFFVLTVYFLFIFLFLTVYMHVVQGFWNDVQGWVCILCRGVTHIVQR